VTKGNGTKENSYVYDSYGNMLHQTEGASNPWKFAGGSLDSSTELDKCRIGCEKNVFACHEKHLYLVKGKVTYETAFWE